MDIRVLWIDDQPNDEFMENAEKYGLYVENRMNVDSGIDELINSSNSYDAIILDANCIKHNDNTIETEVRALGYALRMISEKKISLPWFVYSAGGDIGEDAIDNYVNPYERPYDDKNWYRKPLEIKELFYKIKEVVPKSEIFKIKQKYADVFGILPNWDCNLVEILRSSENGDRYKLGIMTIIRQTAEQLTMFLYSKGVSPVEFPSTSLNNCSKLLGSPELSSIVPLYIQEAFYYVVRISNPLSHSDNEKESMSSNLTSKDYANGNLPYVIRSVTFVLLNILYWCKQFVNDSVSDIEYRRVRVNELLSNKLQKNTDEDVTKYEGNEFDVEEDEDGNLHCERCKISFVQKQYVGHRVRLSKVVVSNSPKTKDKYPFHAMHVEEV